MTNVNVSANAQQETVIEQVYREVFLPTDCRFTLELRMVNGKIRHYPLKEISKHRAQAEAKQTIHHMKDVFKGERLLWRISGDSIWSFESGNAEKLEQPKAKKESLWNRFVDFWFLGEE